MRNTHVLVFIFFNVGQGNSILLILPPDEQSHGHRRYGVIDCHYSKYRCSEPPVLTYLKKHNVKCLEFIILTHADKDHFFGMSKLLKHFSRNGRSFKLFIESPIRSADAAYNKYDSPKIEGTGLNQAEVNLCYNELAIIHEKTFEAYVESKKWDGKAPFQYHSMFKAYDEVPLTYDLKVTILSPCEDDIYRVRNDIWQNMKYRRNSQITSRNLPKRIDCNSASLALKLVYGDSV